VSLCIIIPHHLWCSARSKSSTAGLILKNFKRRFALTFQKRSGRQVVATRLELYKENKLNGLLINLKLRTTNLDPTPAQIRVI
jgi:hypothetical protein